VSDAVPSSVGPLEVRSVHPAQLRVLLVEDDPMDQRLVRRALRDVRRVRFEVEVAPTLAAAREALEDGAFDLVALDLSLPDGSGVDLVDAVTHVAPELPIVVMTGNDDEELALELIHRGIEDYLVKSSFEPAHVGSCFRHAVERHRSRAAVEAARRHAEEASLAKSRFVASMSHEIRTPLNAILGMADLLLEAELELDHRQYVEIFRRTGRNLLFLLNNVLELSCVESGRFQLHEGPFEPVSLARAAVETFAYAAHKKNLHIAVDPRIDADARYVGDEDRIRQVLLNLVGNAVKFTDAGHVSLRIQERVGEGGTVLEIEVEDTGPGVPESARAAIFQSYVRARHGAHAKSGTGLGLSLCHELIARMGGRLSLVSQEGLGSRFTIELPLERLGSTSSSPRRLDGSRSLLAAPDSIERAVLASGLRARGAEVEVAGSAGAARALLAADEDRPFDHLIVDCRFEGGGLELAESLAGSSARPRLVVLMPLDHRRDDVQRARRTGAAVLLRPADPADVCAALLDESPGLAAEGLTPEGTDRIGLPPLRVLLAEDSPENRTLVQAYLKEAPIEVVEAVDGVEAVEAACGGVFDVILMDVNMPNKDGLEATREIRAHEAQHELPPTPILALTAYAFAEQVEACREAGCDEHLAKPIAKRDLLSALGRRGRRVIAVSADHELADLAGDYLEKRREDLATIRAAAEGGDFDRIRILGHNMKGTGLGYGFPHVSVLGAGIEAAAVARDEKRLAHALDGLSALLERA